MSRNIADSHDVAQLQHVTFKRLAASAKFFSKPKANLSQLIAVRAVDPWNVEFRIVLVASCRQKRNHSMTTSSTVDVSRAANRTTQKLVLRGYPEYTGPISIRGSFIGIANNVLTVVQ